MASTRKPDLDNANVGNNYFVLLKVAIYPWQPFFVVLSIKFNLPLTVKKGFDEMNEKTSNLSLALIWFGAGISIAEILTGALIAPLGLSKGLSAIILGHLIGFVLMFFTGLIGGKIGKSAMETAKMSFGQKGSILFSTLNVLQLVGWTAIMIYNGAAAAATILPGLGMWLWNIIIGGLIILWIAIGIKNLGKINSVAILSLFITTILLCLVIFKKSAPTAVFFADSITFGAAVELSVAMPLSWLPLISDYTRNAKKPFSATLTSSAAYFFASCWMYVIGLGAAIFAGNSDIAGIMLKSGLGIAGLIIVIFSTVTTTFLDAYSAGVSANSISPKLREKPIAIWAAILGTILAIFAPVSKTEGFLYIIGSVFAPMIAIQLADFFILKNDSSAKSVNMLSLIIWLIGFVIYRLFMRLDTPFGYTLPAMLVVGILYFIAVKIKLQIGK